MNVDDGSKILSGIDYGILNIYQEISLHICDRKSEQVHIEYKYKQLDQEFQSN